TKTQRRGPADTNASRFAGLLVVSLLLHFPLTPWASIVGLLKVWAHPQEDIPLESLTGIPIDVIEEPAPAAPEPKPESPANDKTGPADTEAFAPKPPPKNKPDPAKIQDAGVPDAEEPDAAAADAGKQSADAGASIKPAGDAGAAAQGDAGVAAEPHSKPLSTPSLIGGARQLVDQKSNVQLWIYADRIRQTPLAPRIGPVLRSLYQWRDFFGPTGVDPIRDIDQILISGPQLRDSSNLMVIIKHHLSQANMHTAVDALVRADHGAGMWLDDGMPAASVHLDGAERRFVLPNAHTVVMTPAEHYQKALALGKMGVQLPPNPGPEAMIAKVMTPWRALIGTPIQIPHSISWALIRVIPTADGGATAELEGGDESEAQAKADAEYLDKTANSLAQLNLGFLGSLLGQTSHKFIEHVEFSASGTTIHGTAHATADQLSTAFDLVSSFMSERSARREPPHGSSAPSSSAPLR
ncbi:MAG TPA: hypothetical protein VHV51_13395, partial [Polyangiaceae bacterium]|nr:hypothetical protein [Polyangiaceae bacterium]